MTIIVVTGNNILMMLEIPDIVVALVRCRFQHPLGIKPVMRILMIDMTIVIVTCDNAPAVLGINNVIWERARV